MRHKDYKRINVWLADLRSKGYVEWIYSTDFLEKSKPGVYYLGLNGIRRLKQVRDYPVEEYPKRYRERSRTGNFRNLCMMIADCCIAMDKLSAKGTRLRHTYATQADYRDPGNTYYFLSDDDLIRPHLCLERTTSMEGTVRTTSYLLEIFDQTTPRYQVKKRLKNYIKYLEDGEWEGTIDDDTDDQNPIIMFVCPTLTVLIYCKRVAKRLLTEKWDEDIKLWFTTSAKLKEHSFTGGIWENVTPPEEEDEDND